MRVDIQRNFDPLFLKAPENSNDEHGKTIFPMHSKKKNDALSYRCNILVYI